MARYMKSPLAAAAQKRLEKWRVQNRTTVTGQSILDFMYEKTPARVGRIDKLRLDHFQPIAPHLDQAIHGTGVFLTYSAPPRHGKSTTIYYTIAMYLLAHPTLKVLYCSYSPKVAVKRSRDDIRPICARVGVEIPEGQAADSWNTRQGGGLTAVGVAGSITGFGYNLIIIDDPYRDRGEAESPTIKENIVDWYSSTSNSRLEPGGSLIITHTRWAPDDLTGYVTDLPDTPFQHYNFPVIHPRTGKPLWPEYWPLEEIEKKRRSGVTEYDWASMYMGEPRPRGMSVFNNTYYYTPEELEAAGRLKIACGIDLAYTSKNYSDYSAAVVLGKALDGRIFVLDVLRMRCSPPQFLERLKGFLGTHDWPPVFQYISGVERGAIELAKKEGITVQTEAAKADKYARAQPAAGAWNCGQILLPRIDSEREHWSDAFTKELLNFTGKADKHDDQVDALAAAYNKLAIPPPARGVGQYRIMPF